LSRDAGRRPQKGIKIKEDALSKAEQGRKREKETDERHDNSRVHKA